MTSRVLGVHDANAVGAEDANAGAPGDFGDAPLGLHIFRDAGLGEPGGEHHHAFDIAAPLHFLHHGDSRPARQADNDQVHRPLNLSDGAIAGQAEDFGFIGIDRVDFALVPDGQQGSYDLMARLEGVFRRADDGDGSGRENLTKRCSHCVSPPGKTNSRCGGGAAATRISSP